MPIKYLKGSEVKNLISKEDDKVRIINVFAEWCGPCKMMAPILEEISQEHEVIKVDLDKNQDFATDMKVQGVPATFIFKGDKLIKSITGYVAKEVITQNIK